MSKNSKRILLVEDHLVLQKIMSKMLSSIATHSCLSFEMDFAQNGKEAIDYFEHNPYQLIMMDIGLLDANGLNIAHRMRSNEDLTKAVTPIAIITAHSDQHYKNQAKDLGIKDFIIKPCTYEIFDALVTKYIKIS